MAAGGEAGAVRPQAGQSLTTDVLVKTVPERSFVILGVQSVTEILLESGVTAVGESGGIDIEEGVAGEAEEVPIDGTLGEAGHWEGGRVVESLSL